MHANLTLCLSVLLLGACVEVDLESEEVASTEAAMQAGSVPAADWMVRRAAKPKVCTATLIGQRFVLTAVHCTWAGVLIEGTRVYFYTGSSGPSDQFAYVKSIHIPPGTSRDGDRTDSSGRTADLAILELWTDAPSTSRAATMVWDYPGAGAYGHIVGAGNPGSELLYNVSHTITNDDDNGQIETAAHVTNGGDSGGSFYDDTRLLGVTLGGTHDEQGVFTSVPEHLPWILTTIVYAWSGASPQSGLYRYGTIVDSFIATTEKVCQYACDRSNCDAYNYAAASDVCYLVQDPTYVLTTSGWRSALK